MMHRAWSSTVEVPYCFSRSYVKFQGHPALKIVKFDPNWAFPDCNSSLNLPMAMKCCTKLETAKERCSIVFLGHPSNFKVTRYKTSPILTQIGHFRTIGRSQLSNPSDLPCYHSQPGHRFAHHKSCTVCGMRKIMALMKSSFSTRYWVTCNFTGLGLWFYKQFVNGKTIAEYWGCLTHWGLNNLMAFILQTFSNKFSWIKTIVFCFKYHWSLLLSVPSTLH